MAREAEGIHELLPDEHLQLQRLICERTRALLPERKPEGMTYRDWWLYMDHLLDQAVREARDEFLFTCMQTHTLEEVLSEL